MSGAESSQGPGWWKANDDRWYPPEQRPTPAPTAAPAGEGGFVKRLFDVSMKTFITPSIITVLFVLGIVLISIFSVVMLIAGAQDNNAAVIVLAPISWFVGIIYLRVLLEVIAVLFRIERNTRPDPSAGMESPRRAQ